MTFDIQMGTQELIKYSFNYNVLGLIEKVMNTTTITTKNGSRKFSRYVITRILIISYNILYEVP